MSQSSTSGGVGLTTVLFIVFLVLKLTDNITWSWWWVFAPYWITGGLALICYGVIGLAALPRIVRIRRLQGHLPRK